MIRRHWEQQIERRDRLSHIQGSEHRNDYPGRKVERSGEINREAYLPAEAWARYVFTSQQPETEVQPFANDILAPGHGLNLRFSQISVFGVSSVDLGAKRERRAKIMQERKSAWKDMSASGLDSQRTGIGQATE